MCKTCGCHSHPLDEQTIKVEGMSCNHCKESVEKALRALPGVMSAEVHLASNTVQVKFDHHKSSLQEIKDAVENIGFTVA